MTMFQVRVKSGYQLAQTQQNKDKLFRQKTAPDLLQSPKAVNTDKPATGNVPENTDDKADENGVDVRMGKELHGNMEEVNDDETVKAKSECPKDDLTDVEKEKIKKREEKELRRQRRKEKKLEKQKQKELNDISERYTPQLNDVNRPGSAAPDLDPPRYRPRLSEVGVNEGQRSRPLLRAQRSSTPQIDIHDFDFDGNVRSAW